MTTTRLFHISGNQYPPFPAQHHTKNIWQELAKGFDEYHVFARSEGMEFSHTVDGNIHLHLVPGFGRRMWVFFFLSWLLPYFVLRYRPSHLVAQCPVLGGLAAALCAVLFRVPLFVELHGAHYFGPARGGWMGIAEFTVYRVLSQLTFLVADRIRSLSDDMTISLRRIYGNGVARKAAAIPTRVDLSIFDHVKTNYEISGTIRIITIGSFYPRKNHCALIRDLHSSGIPFTLTLVGAGPLSDEYIKLGRALGIDNNIRITGSLSHSQLATLLPEHDIYVHYALSEGLPRAILEAMATGLPVVTTRAGFIDCVFRSGVNSYVLDPPWNLALTRTLSALQNCSDTRRRIGQSGRETVLEQFESNKVFEQYRKAILTCCAPASAR